MSGNPSQGFFILFAELFLIVYMNIRTYNIYENAENYIFEMSSNSLLFTERLQLSPIYTRHLEA